MSWDPHQYMKFADHRLRPGIDLLSRIPDTSPRRVIDLGCGTGSLTAMLANRWPCAEVVGLDSAPQMLEKARHLDTAIRWIAGGIDTWRPEAPSDLIFSNATLHWVGNHHALFPRPVAALTPGGILAVQVPRNFDAPSHALIGTVAAQGPWAGSIVTPTAPVQTPQAYYDLLAGRTRSLDIWESEYLQVLEGEDPVLEFVGGTWLRPILDSIVPQHRAAFRAAYAAALRAAYPMRTDGKTLFPFRRLFIVARR